MKEDKIKQFEIVSIELNRYLSYDDKDSAIKCYNKLHGIYEDILHSEVQHNQKYRAYDILTESHKRITLPPQQIMNISEILFLTIFIFLSSIILLTGPEMTAMLIAKQKANLVKDIFMISTVILILLPTAIVIIKNTIKKN